MKKICNRSISNLFIAPFLILAASGGRAESPQPIQWTLSAAPVRAPKTAATVAAHLHAAIQPGWHLYALDQEPGGPTATRISLPAGQQFKIAGDIDQPTPMTSIDPNFNLETRFYEDQVTFDVPVKSAAASRTAPGKLLVDVLYQTCNDTMCLPPTVSHLTATVRR